MRIDELTADDCREILARASLGHLACSRADQPYIVTVSFAYDEKANCLFGVSADGKKITWMQRNPKVCVEVEDVEDRFHWTTVVIDGLYEEIPPVAKHRDTRQHALELFKSRSEWWLPALEKVGGRKAQSLVVYRILIDGITGRRAARNRTE
jgi:nitroimidazol reductase NimA-like FMN-containing flavoprotein (pyridoxamine 5'-phosphate oxidase superfamily)